MCIRDRLETNPRLGSLLPSICSAIGGQFEIKGGELYFVQGEYRELYEVRVTKASPENDETDAPQLGSDVVTKFIPTSDELISGGMAAEGHKKIGILQYLLRNGSLVPGSSGPLLWDEPEANVNPRLMRTIVEAILELSRNGQQVIITTHEYILLKWFDLLSKKEKQDQIRFHVLKGDALSGVSLQSSDQYLNIASNSVDDTFTELYNAEIDRSFEER